mmetsp:Transcript_112980/g.326430  ORF Transcript_112980/g.326430 Transcript_112980/m.326430 type:complete len:720 (+) Transcript_112980:104-2263(+)
MIGNCCPATAGVASRPKLSLLPAYSKECAAEEEEEPVGGGALHGIVEDRLLLQSARAPPLKAFGRSHSSLEESVRDSSPPWQHLKAELSHMLRNHEAELGLLLEQFWSRWEQRGPDASDRGERQLAGDADRGRPAATARWAESDAGGSEPTGASSDLPVASDYGELRRRAMQERAGSASSLSQRKLFAEKLLERSVSFNSLQHELAENGHSSTARQPALRLNTERVLRRQCQKKRSKLATEASGAAQKRIMKLTTSSTYEIMSAAVIILNAAGIAWETEIRARRAWASQGCISEDVHFIVLSIGFACLFSLDLFLRLFALRGQFFSGGDLGFNLFDVIIVGTSVTESIFRIVAIGAGCKHWTTTARNMLATASMLRMFRLLRAIQFTKALRSLLFFRELRIMVSSLCGALVSLCWSIVIFVITFFIFGVFFTDGAIYYAMNPKQIELCSRGGSEQERCEALKFYYGGLFNTMASLYWAMAGGEDWGQVLRPLHELNLFYVIVFYLFITFSMFAMLNVVTSVFVDSTMQRSQNDREFVVQCEMKGKTQFIETMAQVFDELDTDGSGQISLEELEDRINDPHMTAYFSALSLDMRQVRKLFHLMDTDHSGQIDREEFISGCFHLKGAARNLDIAILQHETRRIAMLVLELGSHMDEIAANTAEALAAAERPMPRVGHIDEFAATTVEAGARHPFSRASSRSIPEPASVSHSGVADGAPMSL